MLSVVETGRLRGFGGETVDAPVVNPWATARATVTTAAAAFETARQQVLAELHPAGFQLFEESAGYWKVIQYPESIYTCNADNMKKVSFRGDLWLAAQMNLARLYAAAEGAPFAPGSALPLVGTAERRYVAALFADWYTAVMSWVSLAAYATNIQPAFLCPDSPTTLVSDDGLLLPTRTVGDGLPADLDSVRREIKAFTKDTTTGPWFDATYIAKGVWGPMWMGYYDKGEATGWLAGDFKLLRDPAALDLQQGAGQVNMIWPNRAARPLPANTTWSTVRNRITDPWYEVYYSLLWFDFSDVLADWRQNDTSGRDTVRTRWLLGPSGMLRVGKAWAKWVMSRTIMDVILASSSWYATNYMRYWDKRGLVTFSPSQAKTAQEELARQKQLAKQQVAQQTVSAVTSVGVSVAIAVSAVPIAGPIAAGAALLITGLTALICKRRRKKKLAVPLMQPLMLRTLSDPNCNYFKPTDTIESSLTKILTQVKSQTADLDKSAPGIVPATAADDPLATGVAPVSSAAPGTTVSPTATGIVAVGATASTAINTSVTSTMSPVSVVPTVQQIAAQAVQASQTPPTTSGVALPPGRVPWGVIGIGGVLAAGLLISLRRR